MLRGASSCPHPPLLVPAVSTGAAAEVADLRETCLESVGALTALGPDLIVCLGTGPSAQTWSRTAGGSMRRFGVDSCWGGPDDVLPASLTIAAYLLDVLGWKGDRRYVAVEPAAMPQNCASQGADLVDGGDAMVVLAMGDGSAKRSKAAPGYLDHRAAAFDADVLVALAGPDVEALLAIPPLLAEQLWAAGRPVWQVLAGVAGATLARGAGIETTVRYDGAPYGVGYWVVDWAVREPAEATPPTSAS